jgi:predicted aspartyl protease
MIHRNHAFISTTLVPSGGKGAQSDFLVDTGFRTGLTLNAPFVEEYKVPARSILKRLRASASAEK